MGLLSTRDELAQRFGLLCFSAAWSDPMIWAHYSDKHRGLCLGFEVPPQVEKAQTKKVDYISDPLPFPADFLRLGDGERLAMVNRMIFTKYRHWEYKHEIRTWTDLEEEFFDFCEMLRLAEVIIGAECKLSAEEIAHALGCLGDQVTVRKARAVHNAFQMVEDESSR